MKKWFMVVFPTNADENTLFVQAKDTIEAADTIRRHLEDTAASSSTTLIPGFTFESLQKEQEYPIVEVTLSRGLGFRVLKAIGSTVSLARSPEHLLDLSQICTVHYPTNVRKGIYVRVG